MLGQQKKLQNKKKHLIIGGEIPHSPHFSWFSQPNVGQQ